MDAKEAAELEAFACEVEAGIQAERYRVKCAWATAALNGSYTGQTQPAAEEPRPLESIEEEEHP